MHGQRAVQALHEGPCAGELKCSVGPASVKGDRAGRRHNWAVAEERGDGHLSRQRRSSSAICPGQVPLAKQEVRGAGKGTICLEFLKCC